MTAQERLQLLLGQKDMQICMLTEALETAQKRITELEALLPDTHSIGANGGKPTEAQDAAG